MTDVFLARPLDPSPLPRLLHGGAALLITLGGLIFAAILVSFVIGGKISARADLAARMQSIETLEATLETQQAELSANLALIGAPREDWKAVLSPERVLELLNEDADRLGDALERYGFSAANQSDAAERPLTAALSIYTVSINFTGDTKAAAGLFSAGDFPDAPVNSLRLQNNSAAGPESLTLSFNIERIAASRKKDDAQIEGAANE